MTKNEDTFYELDDVIKRLQEIRKLHGNLSILTWNCFSDTTALGVEIIVEESQDTKYKQLRLR